jgi:hypothetical protein
LADLTRPTPRIDAEAVKARFEREAEAERERKRQVAEAQAVVDSANVPTPKLRTVEDDLTDEKYRLAARLGPLLPNYTANKAQIAAINAEIKRVDDAILSFRALGDEPKRLQDSYATAHALAGSLPEVRRTRQEAEALAREYRAIDAALAPLLEASPDLANEDAD